MFGRLVNKPIKFTPLSQKDDSEAPLSSRTSLDTVPPLRTRVPSWCAISALVITSSCLTGLLGMWAGTHWLLNPDKFCIRHTSQYSPILEELDLGYEVIRFNGSLLKANIFRQPAGPEVDAAWESLGVDYRSVAIPPDQAAQSGILPDQVKVSQKYGGGFIANVEGLHQLHCLNLLRKSLYYNFDYYHALGKGPFANSDYVLRYHVTHCLDIVRQQLMCSIDIGVLGQVWFQPPPSPFAEPYVDFNTRHKCRNFDAVRAWAEAHQIPPPEAVNMEEFYEEPKEGDTIYSVIP